MSPGSLYLRLLIAGLLAYGFLRYFLDPMPSSLGGVAFMLTGFFTFNVNLDNLSTEILAPLVLISFEELFRSSSTKSWLLGLGSVWLLLISGMPESAVVILCLGYGYFAFRVLTSFRNIQASLWAPWGRLAACSLLGIALSAFLLVHYWNFCGMGMTLTEARCKALVLWLLTRIFFSTFFPWPPDLWALPDFCHPAARYSVTTA